MISKARVLAVLVATGCIGAASREAPAAALDCGRSTTVQERLICSNPVLSDLNGQVDQAYQAGQARLSQHGAELLRHSQQSWAQFVATICVDAAHPDAKFRKAPAACLEVVYRDRLSALEQVGKRIGPFVFNRIDLYAAEPDPDGESGQFPGFFVQQVATAQIDDPRSSEAAAWNARHAQTLQPAQACDASYGDEANILSVRFANQQVITTENVSSLYCHGAPHGVWSTSTETLVLKDGLRALTVNDVFGAGDG